MGFRYFILIWYYAADDETYVIVLLLSSVSYGDVYDRSGVAVEQEW